MAGKRRTQVAAAVLAIAALWPATSLMAQAEQRKSAPAAQQAPRSTGPATQRVPREQAQRQQRPSLRRQSENRAIPSPPQRAQPPAPRAAPSPTPERRSHRQTEGVDKRAQEWSGEDPSVV